MVSMSVTDRPAETISRRGHDDQMGVVGHKAIGPYLDAPPFTPLGHQRNVGQVVVFTEKRLRENESFGRIRSKGDSALFGGRTTQDMKSKLGVPKGRPLADFLPTITIKAKDFANEITNFNIRQNALRTEPRISDEHVKKVERRLKSEQKKLPKQVDRLEGPGGKDTG